MHECNCCALANEQMSAWFCLGILACVSVFASVLSEALCICLFHMLWRVKEKKRCCLICACFDMMTQGQERSRCRRDPVHHARPGQLQQSYLGRKVCLANLNIPEPFISFVAYRMVYSTLFAYPSKMMHRWEMGIRLTFFPAFSRPSGQHIVPFHSSWACLRLASQKAT